MAKLERKSAKVFAENATAGIGGVSQFGSLAAGDPQYSKDVDVIQELPAYKNGWSSAVVGNKSPAIEDRNALDYLLSYQQAYIMQHGVPEWLSTETYYKNSYVVDSNGELRYSLIDDNTGRDPIDDEPGQQYWAYGGSRGASKNIGEVFFSQSSLTADNPGALPLFTGEVIANANNIYPQFYAWVQSHTSLCVTEAQYQERITQYGECPFYVITSTTIRLPKLTNYIKMALNGNNIGQSSAGLPNITGSVVNSANNDEGPLAGQSTGTGAFRTYPAGGNGAGDYNDTGNWNFNFDASLSSSIYGNSSTVTPPHTTVFPWVYVYNSAIPASTAQAAEFLGSLSNKADKDFSNIDTSGKALSAGWGMPDYSAGIIQNSNTEYTSSVNGYIVIYQDTQADDTIIKITITYNNTTREFLCGHYTTAGQDIGYNNVVYPIPAGATYKTDYGKINFFPCIGGTL